MPSEETMPAEFAAGIPANPLPPEIVEGEDDEADMLDSDNPQGD